MVNRFYKLMSEKMKFYRFTFFSNKNYHGVIKRFFTLSLLLFPFFSIAQIEQHLTWKSEVEKISDNEFKIKFICTLDEDWHTFSQFTSENGPLPTQFRFEKNPNIELVGKMEEISKKKTYFDELFGVKVTSFIDDAVFVQRVKLKSKKAILKGEFDGQVCKDEVGCMPFGPEKFSIELNAGNTSTVSVIEDTILSKKTRIVALKDSSVTPTALSPTNISPQKFDWTYAKNSCSTDAQTETKNAWWIFIAGFIGGLLALLTPCVFPMVPLTVSYFTKGGKEQKSGISKALIYGISIIVIYVALGLIITSLFGSDALNAMSTNVWFNLLFFVIFVLFALSFFGLFEITLPSSWANKTDSLSSKGGNLGIFFMAFTLALVSFSCTGPIIGTLLVMGGSSLFFGLLGFSIALALPFTLFAMFPNWLQSLPKSGGWLTTVKVILGFIELALAFKFLSVADMTMNWNLLKFEPFMLIWILIFGVMSLYCLGIFFKPKPTKVVKGLGVATLLFTLYLVYALINYKPIQLLSGIIPPTTYNFKTKNETPFVHFKDYDKGMEYAKAHNMPILLDFTGFGCVNCRKIEDNVWSDVAVQEKLKQYVIISLYVDDRKALPEDEWFVSSATGKEREIKTVGQKWSAFQAEHFKTNSQPLYVLLNTKEQLLNQPVAYSYSKDKQNYISFLECGLKMNKQLK